MPFYVTDQYNKALYDVGALTRRYQSSTERSLDLASAMMTASVILLRRCGVPRAEVVQLVADLWKAGVEHDLEAEDYQTEQEGLSQFVRADSTCGQCCEDDKPTP